MRVKTEILQSKRLVQWLNCRIDGLEIPSDDRNRLAAGCLSTALEHQQSIILLIENALFGSAAALVRLEFEAYIRGIWLLYCASESEVEKFKNDKIEKNFRRLIEDVEKHEAFSAGTLSHVKEVSWQTMNSLTHSGFYQTVRRITAEEIISNFSDDEIVDALDTANSFGVLTAIAIADMAGDETLAREVLERGIKFIKSMPP